MPPPPINRTLCKLNPFLRLLSNLGCSGKEAAAIWRLVEGASPTFCGYGEISLGALLDPKRDKALWDRKEALFFAFRNCEDASGVTHIPHHHDEIEDDGIDIDIDIDDEYDENDADGGGLTRSQAVERLHSYAVDDFFARRLQTNDSSPECVGNTPKSSTSSEMGVDSSVVVQKLRACHALAW